MWVLVAIVILGGLGLLVMQSNSQEKAMMEQNTVEEKEKASGEAMMEGGEAMMEGGEAMMEQDGNAMMAKGSYEQYDASKLTMAEAGKVVLFFKASWCPTCRALDADIKANVGTIPGGVTILEVDYDTSTELKRKYGVTMQHTLVQVDSQGNLLNKWSGGNTLASVTEKIK